VTVGLDGHRRVERRWTPRLADLDGLSRARPTEMDDGALRRHTDRLLDGLGWWFMEISFFASLVRVGQMLVGRPPGLPDPGALFRGNDSQLLESERAARGGARSSGDGRLPDALRPHGRERRPHPSDAGRVAGGPTMAARRRPGRPRRTGRTARSEPWRASSGRASAPLDWGAARVLRPSGDRRRSDARRPHG